MTVPVLLMLLVGYLQWRSVIDYRAAREAATHTRMVLLNLESFLAGMNDAETGQRGYLLTHKESYLEPYNEALLRIPVLLQTLRELTSDNAVQQKNLDRLEPLVTAKLDELAHTVALEKSLDHSGALTVVMSDFGKDTMDQIRATLSDMHTVQRGLLQEREEAYQRTARVNADRSLLLIVVGIGFIVVIYLLLRRLERMQSMVTICAWSKLIEYEGEWLSVEEYLSRRLNAQVTHGISRIEAEKMLRLLEEEKLKAA